MQTNSQHRKLSTFICLFESGRCAKKGKKKKKKEYFKDEKSFLYEMKTAVHSF